MENEELVSEVKTAAEQPKLTHKPSESTSLFCSDQNVAPEQKGEIPPRAHSPFLHSVQMNFSSGTAFRPRHSRWNMLQHSPSQASSDSPELSQICNRHRAQQGTGNPDSPGTARSQQELLQNQGKAGELSLASPRPRTTPALPAPCSGVSVSQDRDRRGTTASTCSPFLREQAALAL